jgi:hypothetical protein
MEKMKTMQTKDNSRSFFKKPKNGVMSDDAFAKLVAEEVKNRVSSESRSYLLEKENWNRWRKALTALIDNLDGQIEDIYDDIAADTERYSQIEDGSVLLSTALASYEMRKKKIERFRFYVQNRLAQVDKMIHTGVAIEEEPLVALLLLKRAIRMHKQLMFEQDLEDTDIDRALWATLDGKWLFDEVGNDND